MPLRMRDTANVLRTMSLLRMRDASNVLRTAQMIRMRDAANVLRTVYVSMTVSASPSSVTGSRGTFGGPPVPVVSQSTYATPSGGTAPYTYAWARVSGSATIGANSPTMAQTTFGTAALALNDEVSAVFEVSVTDDNGAVAKAQVSVTLYHADLT